MAMKKQSTSRGKTRLLVSMTSSLIVLLSMHALSAHPASTVQASQGTPTSQQTSVAPQVTHGTWHERASMPTPRSETAAAVLDGQIYVPGGFGGPDTFEAYDPDTDTWRALTPLPEGRNHLMVAALNGDIYVFGGGRDNSSTATDTVWKYDPNKAAWSVLGLMPEPRYAGAAVVLGDYAYIVGGQGGTQVLLRYDPQADRWTKLAVLLEPREHLAAVALRGQIYALAGRWQGQVSNSVQVYNPDTDSWTFGTPLHDARSGFGAAVLDDHVIVAGGEVFEGGAKALTSVEAYDAGSDHWEALPSLPVGIHGNPVANIGNSLFVLGGSDRAAGIDNRGRVLVYTIP
jgi:N-acetylneuraminic acid mutarotase